MRFSRFFIDRPIFAAVISIVITLVGVFAFRVLPLAQYPDIAPPTIAITAVYPGASAETVAETVAAPIEQEINGVEGMLYMTSSSTADGMAQIMVTFRQGTDLDDAQVLVQNRVSVAEPRLPEQVRQVGVTVNKQLTGFLMVVALSAKTPDADLDHIGNFAYTTLRDRLLRVPGVGGVQLFSGIYSMRVWIDPAKAAARGLTADDIIQSLRRQNIQAAGGMIGQAPQYGDSPAHQLPVQVEGRLSSPEEFGEIVVRTDPDGRVIRLRDVARVELGAQDYNMRGFFDGEPGVAMAVLQQPGSNALSTAEAVLKVLEETEADLPSDARIRVPYNPTEFVQASVTEVQRTLIEACLLVVIVVLVFLQTWRAAIIPILAIPVALLGAFGILLALGYSINSLSLFALVLAVGIVVDDAIVVVESVERHIREGLSPREAAYKTMDEVSGALIAIGLVLMAVFVPAAFMPGIPGQFYRQFAVTISAATAISLLVSLTLSPALAAILLKPHRKGPPTGPAWMRPLRAAGDKFNAGFDWLSARYGRLTSRLVRTTAVVLAVYVGLIALAGWRMTATPTGFIPEQDQGFLIGVVQLPPGASLDRTEAAMRKVWNTALETPGVDTVAAFAGMDGASFSASSNGGVMFIALDEYGTRPPAQDLANQLMGKLGGLDEASVFFLPPPPVEGMGNAGGFKMMVQDRSGAGYRQLEQAAGAVMGAAQQERAVAGVFSGFNTGSPRLVADVDREKALMLGIDPSQVYSALGAYLGSTYVNDFNMLGRTFRVTAQAEASERDDPADVANLRVRGPSGEMTPIGSLATLREETGPVRVVRYNLFPAAEVQGAAAPGVSSGDALGAMERIADQALPQGFGFEWTELALQERMSGSGTIIFVMAAVLVFLVLAAQYEALTLPLAVILIVPMCLLAAFVGVNIRGQDNNILTQVGLLVLMALAAKNAILIVEFAKQGEERGLDRFQAAIEAARVRLRPILMTSVAFISGVVPLAFAHGPGAEMRQALGTAVFFGMIGVTAFGLVFTPVFYVVCRAIGEQARRLRRRVAPSAELEAAE
ncbi:MAG: multidrug efflux RND transporter permease subunit [Phenylobacterium sp.]|jgi:hydrophobe/amphiphile efflux-1 (HAE1) family protein|uniref:efflux RND transporter permease subunit n=1 Tax=Phenylobacterium sp. TaxID=1871053 RepID=UPI002A3664A6|nr:multidrug efflux RND transporter permease subunit [Phenylobacterium sp.]MDX9999155.1 multidrug efflux RND transporter permease subunit [Phenylobacterium sp.]